MAKAYDIEGWLEKPIRLKTWGEGCHCFLNKKEWRFKFGKQNDYMEASMHPIYICDLFNRDDWELFEQPKKVEKWYEHTYWLSLAYEHEMEVYEHYRVITKLDWESFVKQETDHWSDSQFKLKIIKGVVNLQGFNVESENNLV